MSAETMTSDTTDPNGYVIRENQDITARPDLARTTGRVTPTRTRRPVYLDMLPPCNAGCPAGENIQEWLRLIKAHEEEKAWRQLTADNPFPAIHGRVCYHPCEVACNRADLDGAVSIHSVERYLGDLAIEKGWTFTGPRSPPGTASSSLALARPACLPPTTSQCLATTSRSTTRATKSAA